MKERIKELVEFANKPKLSNTDKMQIMGKTAALVGEISAAGKASLDSFALIDTEELMGGAVVAMCVGILATLNE